MSELTLFHASIGEHGMPMVNENGEWRYMRKEKRQKEEAGNANNNNNNKNRFDFDYVPIEVWEIIIKKISFTQLCKLATVCFYLTMN